MSYKVHKEHTKVPLEHPAATPRPTEDIEFEEILVKPKQVFVEKTMQTGHESAPEQQFVEEGEVLPPTLTVEDGIINSYIENLRFDDIIETPERYLDPFQRIGYKPKWGHHRIDTPNG